MILPAILSLIRALGFILNGKNKIMILISIEIMLLFIAFPILLLWLNIINILDNIYITFITLILGIVLSLSLCTLRGSIVIYIK